MNGIAIFDTPAVQFDSVAQAPHGSGFRSVSLEASQAVTVEDDRIVAFPEKMILGLGYPVVLKGRRWWVQNVDGDTIRYYRGPRV